MLLNHSAIYASVRLFGAECTEEVTYPGFARQLGAVVPGRGGSLGRGLFSRLTCILAPLSLCCCRFYGSHPACTGGREDLWGCAFGSGRSGTTAMLKSFCGFIPRCPNRSSSPHLEQPLLTKLQQWRATYKMSKWSQFGSQDALKLLGCEELSSGALQEVTSPAPVTMVRTSMEP